MFLPAMVSFAAVGLPPPALEMQADDLQVDVTHQHLVGHKVIVSWGELRLCCGRLKAQLQAQGVRGFTCTSSVVMEGPERLRVTSEEVQFSVEKQTLVFEGQVVVKASYGVLHAPRMAYNMRRSQLVTSGGRAHFMGSSEVQAQEAAADCLLPRR